MPQKEERGVSAGGFCGVLGGERWPWEAIGVPEGLGAGKQIERDQGLRRGPGGLRSAKSGPAGGWKDGENSPTNDIS